MRYLVIFVLVVAAALVAQPTTTPPMTGYVSYASSPGNVPANQVAYCTWLMAHFKILEATYHGVDCTTYRGTGNDWSTYVDGAGLYSYEYYTDIVADGFPIPDDAMLHMKVDNIPAHTWTSADQFDSFERTNKDLTSTATHGVMNGATDVTVIAYSGASSFTVSGNLTIGNWAPFDTVHVTVHTARVGGTVTYQYWNGTSYTTLPSVTDGTLGQTVSGTMTFPPPANWVPNVDGGTLSKYHIRWVVSGTSTAPVISQIKGDTLLTGGSNRGWNASNCGAPGVINSGTSVAYCANPGAGSTAKFKQQALAMGEAASMQFFGNPGNIQGGVHTWASVEMARVAAQLALSPSGYNGVMFDDSATPINQSSPSFLYSNTDINDTGSTFTSWLQGQTDLYTRLHASLASTYGSYPTFWSGGNVYTGTPVSTLANQTAVGVVMNWTNSENFADQSDNALNGYTADSPLFCTDTTWCPAGLPSTPNTNGAFLQKMMLDGALAGVTDGNGTALANDHLWDMTNRSPMNDLAMYWTSRSDKTVMALNTISFNAYVNVGDDAYKWSMSGATVGTGGISARTCPTGCSIPISGPLGVSCPGGQGTCAIRIGGVGGDIVLMNTVSGYTGTTSLTTANGAFFLQSWPANTQIEYVTEWHQSTDTPPSASQLYYYAAYFPAMSVDLGTPDAANGFNYPCNGLYLQGSPGCLWKAGTAITTDGCTGTTCSPLLRRDFSGGPLGYVIVLMRPAAYQNAKTASIEYDTYCTPQSLGGTYYPLNADGTFGAATTTASLRGGESGIYVSTPSGNPLMYVSPVSFSLGAQFIPYGPVDVVVNGGTAPYTCTLHSGSWPNGIGMSGCVISGTPTVAGTFSGIVIQVNDSASGVVTSPPLSLSIRPVFKQKQATMQLGNRAVLP